MPPKSKTSGSPEVLFYQDQLEQLRSFEEKRSKLEKKRIGHVLRELMFLDNMHLDDAITLVDYKVNP